MQQQAGGSHPVLTTQQGIAITDNQNSLRTKPRGPTLLEDFILREKITHFDHERIPERVVHARGSGAHGFFELTDSLEQFTTAKVLTEVGKQTPIFVRISTVAGRMVGILVDDGSSAKSIAALRKAIEAEAEGAHVKIVAPKVGGAQLDNGSHLPADGQLAGTPSALFDAVASVLAPERGARLAKEAAAVDWFRDAFGHLKAIAACKGSQPILQAAGIEPDAGVVGPSDIDAFLAAAKTRQWDREPKLRTLA